MHAWCGPQPNSRLLINYGIVDENNPYDKVSVVATVPTGSPLFQLKRRVLETAGVPAPLCSFQPESGTMFADKCRKVTFADSATVQHARAALQDMRRVSASSLCAQRWRPSLHSSFSATSNCPSS